MLRALIVKNYQVNLLKQAWYILSVSCTKYCSFFNQLKAHQDN